MPPMTTCPDRTRLKELLDGSLPEAEQADLNRHLDGCEPCQHTLEELAAGKETWSGVAEQLRQCDSTPEAGLRRVLEENRAGSETGPESGDESPLDFLSPSDDPAHLGRIAQYEILEVIGRGGNGVVLKAFDTVLRRIVAVKVLSPQLATTASARRRFERESRAAAAVSH